MITLFTCAQFLVLFKYRLGAYHGLVSSFAVKKTKALIDMRDEDARMIRLRLETLFGKFQKKSLFKVIVLVFLL